MLKYKYNINIKLKESYRVMQTSLEKYRIKTEGSAYSWLGNTGGPHLKHSSWNEKHTCSGKNRQNQGTLN